LAGTPVKIAEPDRYMGTVRCDVDRVRLKYGRVAFIGYRLDHLTRNIHARGDCATGLASIERQMKFFIKATVGPVDPAAGTYRCPCCGTIESARTCHTVLMVSSV
jgi:hypothetical protein